MKGIGSFKDMMRSGVSRAAQMAATAGMNLGVSRKVEVDRKAGANKRGHSFRRIIGHRVLGPFFNQVGWKRRSETDLLLYPVMERYHLQEFFHATKGPRTYKHGLPMPGRARRPEFTFHLRGKATKSTRPAGWRATKNLRKAVRKAA